MSTIAPVAIIILSMLIIAFLQLVPGTFSIFYHFALSKNNPQKADDLSLSFILGTEMFISFVWIMTYIFIFVACYNLPDFCPDVAFWILAGTCLAEAIAILFFYFRRKNNKRDQSTALFIPRRVASTLSARARRIKSRSDAITLGFFTGLPELIFTLPLYILSAIILLDTTIMPRALIIILYVVIATIPLFTIRTRYRTGHNLADITRSRARIKPFIRIGLSFAFLLLAIAALSLGIENHG